MFLHVKYQVLLSLKNNEKKSRLPSAAVVVGALRINRKLSVSLATSGTISKVKGVHLYVITP